MSKNCWERGEIKMSVKEFGAVRRDLIAFNNERQTRLFNRSKEIYTALKNAGAGKRGFDFHSAYNAIMTSNHSIYSSVHDADGYDEIQDALFPYESSEHFTGRSRKPKAPKKNQFAMLKQNAEGINVGGEAGIGFNKKTRVITWGVSENNHAVERAREHAMGREFFKRMSRVVWTRSTGGTIWGNDEYNEDAGRDHAGSGGSYVTARYGTADKAFKAGRIR
jgi:hypothetical protein